MKVGVQVSPRWSAACAGMTFVTFAQNRTCDRRRWVQVFVAAPKVSA